MVNQISIFFINLSYTVYERKNINYEKSLFFASLFLITNYLNAQNAGKTLNFDGSDDEVNCGNNSSLLP